MSAHHNGEHDIFVVVRNYREDPENLTKWIEISGIGETDNKLVNKC